MADIIPPGIPENSSDSDKPGSVIPGRLRRQRSYQFAAVLIACMVMIGAYSLSGSGPTAPEPLVRVAQPEGNASSGSNQLEVPEENESQKITASSIVGKWLKKGNIRREVELRPDGTASMNIQLDFVSGLLYGRETNFELVWELDDGILTHSIISGTPKANVDRIKKDFGDSISYRVVSVNASELILEDLDGKQKQDRWTAVK